MKKRVRSFIRKKLPKVVSLLLAVSMVMPNMAPLIAYGAEYLENRPRYVDFARPEALSLANLELHGAMGTPSDAVRDDRETDKPDKASPSDADVRIPGNYYEPLETDEPDGELVQFNHDYRTYKVDDRSYISVLGGYSGLYKDKDGRISRVDNTLVSSETKKRMTRSAAYILEGDSPSEMAEDSAGFYEDTEAEEREGIPAVYQNASGSVDVTIPSKPTSSKGIRMASGSDFIELFPLGGSFKKSAAVGNAIRYNDVYPGIDIQYTMRGDTVKEDIILLEPSEQTTFSYKVRTSGLKAAQAGKSIIFYKTDKKSPVFLFEAPYMEDADGEMSTALAMKLTGGSDGSYEVSVTADKKWLNEESRQYPVRIDPAPQVPPNEFMFCMASQGQPNAIYNWDANAYVGYIDEKLKNCRQYVALGSDQDSAFFSMFQDAGAVCTAASLIVTTKTNNSHNANVFTIGTPTVPWNANRLNWNGAPPFDKTGLQQSAPGINGSMDFDITTILNDWISGKKLQAGFVIMAAEEPGESTSEELRSPGEILFNRKDTSGPKIVVEWEGDSPADSLEYYPVTETTLVVTPSVRKTDIDGGSATGVLAHGKTTAGADVTWELVDTTEGGTASGEEELLYPDFEAAGLEHDFPVVPKSNWQSSGMDLETLEVNTIYQFRAKAEAEVLDEAGEPVGEEEASEEKLSDTFLIYHVQQDDLIQRIARHYKANPNVVAKDNHIYLNQLTEMDTYLFIRKPDPNVGEYTYNDMTPWEDLVLKGLLQGAGIYCEFGFEPINLNTGNFYMTQVDASLPELGGEFKLQRAYNSLLPNNRSEFGKGWSGSFGEHLTMLPDGRILYRQNDGALLPFTKDGEVYKGPDGYNMIVKPLDTFDIVLPKIPEPPVATASNAAFSAKVEAPEDTEDTEESEEPEDTEEPETGTKPSVAGWELTYLDGSSILFDNSGFMHYKKDRQGNTTVFSYDEDYRLTEVQTPSGKLFGVEMDDNDRIIAITLPDGEAITYEYDEDGRLSSVTDQEGGVRRYEYDAKNRMTAWYDENGRRIVENTYDEMNRVVTQMDANGNTAALEYAGDHTTTTDNRGNVTEYWYDEQKRTTRIAYPDGSTVTREYDESGHLAAVTDERGTTTSYTYDENGNILTETRDGGASASYTYNEQNQPLTATDYEGNTSVYTYDEAGNLLSVRDGEGNTVSYSYDSVNRLEAVTDANGAATSFTYDGAAIVSMTDGEGYTSTFIYDAMNRLLTTQDPMGHMQSNAYDRKGRKTSETGKDGGETAYEFDPAGCVLSLTDPMGVTTVFTYDAMYNILSGKDALGNTLTYTYDASYNKISETDAKGNRTTYDFDSRNRLVKSTDALGQDAVYTYDGRGNITKTTDRRGNAFETWYHKELNLPTMRSDKLGHETYYTYDDNGNLLKVSYPDGSTQAYEYDSANRVIRTTAQSGLKTELSYDGNGNIIRITDDDTRIYTFGYDRSNRLVKTTDPLGGITEYAYDAIGNQTETTDAEEHRTDYAYDAAGRLEEARDALEGTTSLGYDKNGNILKATDQNGGSTVYQYDVLGQLLAQTDAAGYITAMEYDSLGNLTKTTDALKGETAIHYDALSRTTKLTDPMGHEYTYEYDPEGNLVKATAPDSDTVTMTYDANGQMASSTDEAGVITTYTYDSMGRVTLAEDNTGNKMSYAYDIAGNLVLQTDTIGRKASYTYDKWGRPSSVTGVDGAKTTYTYDALDRLIGVEQADGAVTAYEYDKVGNLVKTTEPGEAVYTYAYDAINRLTSKVDPLGAATAFQYDAKGNLLSTTDAESTENSYLYDAIDRLTSFTDGNGHTAAYEYDELSRLLSYTTADGSRNEYRYDADSNMTKQKDPNGLITEYVYDVMGNLTESISPKGAKTLYTYDSHDELTSITDPAGNLIKYEVDLNRQVTEMTQKNGGTYSYVYDAVHRLTSITSPLGYTQNLTYDDGDNIVKESDNLGRTNTYTYDIMHRMTASVNASGGEETYEYDIRGNQSAVTNANGIKNTYVYDLLDRMNESIDPEGKATKVIYDLVGNVTSVTTPGDRTTNYYYDKNYNMTSYSDPMGYVYQNAYDKDNRQTVQTDPLSQTTKVSYDAGSRITSLTDKMGLTQSFTYDAHSNVLTSRATNGLITKYQYDILDELTMVTDPMSNQTKYEYDVMGNVTAMTNAKQKVTKYTYDLENNLTSITSPMGRKDRFTYDVSGRPDARYTANGDTIRYDYDKLNGLSDKHYYDSKGNEKEHEVRMGYDAMGQRISMEDITGDSTYTYDSLGRLQTATNGSGKVVEYEYDTANNLAAIHYPDGKEVRYAYDKNDNIISITDRDGRVTTSTYDALNRMTSVTRGNGIKTTYTYNARNQALKVENTCVCGFLISSYDYTYNDAGLITAETAKESLYTTTGDDYGHQGGSEDKCAHKDKNYWQNQNPVWETTKSTFKYDDNGELIECKEVISPHGWNTYTYQYDEVGNRIKAKRTSWEGFPEIGTYVYNDDNQMTTAWIYKDTVETEYTYKYDANGNMLRECEGNRSKAVFQYDTENRLQAVYDPFKLLYAAAYDGDGNRTFQLNYDENAVCGYGKNMDGKTFVPEHSQNEDGSLTAEGLLFSYVNSKTGRTYDLIEYVNDTNREYTEALMEYSINGESRTAYSYGNQRLSLNKIWKPNDVQTMDVECYYGYDGRGSVTNLTDCVGMSLNVYQYDPYGQMTLGSPLQKNLYGYNGGNYNPNTGLEYLRARYYNANQGRFIQEDSYLGDIAEPLTLNRYAYVKNSPLNYMDPSGHKAGNYLDSSGHITTDDAANPQRPVGGVGSQYSNSGAFWGTLGGALLAGLMAASAPVSLPVALFIIGVGGATGMMAGGSIQKEYEIGLKENDIDSIKYVIMQNQLTLHKIAKGDYVNQLEYMQLRADMEDLEEQFSQNLCDIAEYENQMEMYRTGALSTVVLVGGASISLQKLMAMSAQQAQSAAKLTEVTKYTNGEGGSVVGLDKKLMSELAESGVKYNVDDVIMVTKTAEGKIVWLEKGNSSAGYQHILNHADEFATKGITVDQLPNFISSAVSKGKIVDMQGTRPIYEVMYNDSLQRVAITVGNNGFIVGANPVSLP